MHKKHSKPSSKKPEKDKKNSCPNFLKKTYEIVDSGKYTEMVQWNEGGDSFVIKKPKDFAQKVLPIYFKHNNFSSFSRHLNMYGFKKSKSQCYDNHFQHEHFRRGSKDELKLIKRKLSDNVVLFKKNKLIDQEQRPEDRESLVQENYVLKRVMLEINHKIRVLQSESLKVTYNNQMLYNAIQEQDHNLETLKMIINTITCLFGKAGVEKAVSSFPCKSTEQNRVIKDLLDGKFVPSASKGMKITANDLFGGFYGFDPLDLPIGVHNEPDVSYSDHFKASNWGLSSLVEETLHNSLLHDETAELLKHETGQQSPRSLDTYNSKESSAWKHEIKNES